MVPMAAVYQAQLEASRRCADALLSGTEKIDRAVIDVAHRMFMRQLNFAQAMTAARDPRSVANMQSSLLAPNDAVNCQQEIMRIFAEMQNEIGRSLQEYAEQIGGHAASSAAPVEEVREKASETALNPIAGMFSVWESAFKEATALARKNMDAAQSAMEDAASKAMESAGGFTRGANGSGETRGRSPAGGHGGRATHDGSDKRGTQGRRK
jgi:hypothetical protein